MEISQITGAILAGGRGARMGEADKGLQLLHGKPLVSHVLARLAPQVGAVMINANRNIVAYEAFGVPVLPDEVQDFSGPLAGIQVALRHCSTRYLATSPCDTPFMPIDLVAALGEGLTAHDADIAVAVTGTCDQKMSHPVFCLLEVSLLENLNRYIAGGGRKVKAWQETLKVAEVHFAHEPAFENINTPADLQKFNAFR